MAVNNQVSAVKSFPLECQDATQVVYAILSSCKENNDNYYAYEGRDGWKIGVGSRASLHLDATGQYVTLSTAQGCETLAVDRPFSQVARDFILDNSDAGEKVFGFAGFNYALHVRGLPYNPGRWPLASLMVPRVHVVIEKGAITITGGDESDATNIMSLARGVDMVDDMFDQPSNPDLATSQQEYIETVTKALSAIHDKRITKVIASRAIPIPSRVDMPATLLRGRMSNSAKRTFSMSHDGYQATGFSPELVMSCIQGKVITEPLAGTRACKGTESERQELRRELENDPKEIVEHMISVKEAIHELRRVCSVESVVVQDLMSVRVRGHVQHLASTVAGSLLPGKGAWDAFDVLFPSITASGIPKDAALEVIGELESGPRELYSGAILLLEGPDLFEAALVLRTVFQDQNRQWVQVGAGIISLSNPERELAETCEKLESIGPQVVVETMAV